LSDRPQSRVLRARSISAVLIGLSLAGLIVSSQAQGTTVTLLSRDARRTLPVNTSGNQVLVALDDLASAFQLAVREEGGAVTVSYRGQTIVLTPNQALASVAKRLVSLPGPLTRTGGRWFVPIEFISQALGPIYDSRLEVRRPSRLVIIGDLRVPRISITADSSANAARLTIDAAPAATSAITQETGRLIVRYEADLLDVSLPQVTAPGLVQGIRIADASALAIDLGPRFSSFRASTQTAGSAARLTLDILAAASTETAAPPAATPATAPPAGTPPPSELPVFGQPVAGLRTVAIDAGHGGDDVGARGPNGTEEKSVTLSTARRIKALLEGRLGVRVLMTREDDRSIPAGDRVAIANNNKADVFISLHANAALRPAAGGASIYVAEFDERDKTQTSLAPERLPVFGGGSRDIELVLWDFAQIRHVDRSSEFARMLEESMRGRTALQVRPVDRAPFRVLESANMPAVLVEMGFLTNPDEEKALAGAAFQNAFAQTVLEALTRFRGAIGGAISEQ
jgi:N-acetylmuramoyl-L-alanine amidase